MWRCILWHRRSLCTWDPASPQSSSLQPKLRIRSVSCTRSFHCSYAKMKLRLYAKIPLQKNFPGKFFCLKNSLDFFTNISKKRVVIFKNFPSVVNSSVGSRIKFIWCRCSRMWHNCWAYPPPQNSCCAVTPVPQVQERVALRRKKPEAGYTFYNVDMKHTLWDRVLHPGAFLTPESGTRDG